MSKKPSAALPPTLDRERPFNMPPRSSFGAPSIGQTSINLPAISSSHPDLIPLRQAFDAQVARYGAELKENHKRMHQQHDQKCKQLVAQTQLRINHTRLAIAEKDERLRREAMAEQKLKEAERELEEVNKRLDEAQEQMAQLQAERADDRRLMTCLRDIHNIVRGTAEAMSVLEDNADFTDTVEELDEQWKEMCAKRAHSEAGLALCELSQSEGTSLTSQ